MKSNADNSNVFGEDILSTQRLGTHVKRLTWAVGVLSVVVVASIAVDAVKQEPRPLLLDTSTGNIITNYKHVLDGYTEDERALLARLTYEGLRRRTGNAAVDAQTLKDWSGNITMNGFNAWRTLGERWKEPHFVQPGFSRTLQVLSVRPDRASKYAFTVEAIESDAEADKRLTHKQFRVRFTMFFTPPSEGGTMKLDGIVLHEEELV